MKYKYNKNQGQILILGISLLFTICLCILVVFNTTQEEYEKQQATNISDAAVYSALSLEARNLNYIAYANRAILTNQIAQGQMVSLASWLTYTADITQVVADIVQFIPIVGPLISTILDVGVDILELYRDAIPYQMIATNMAIELLNISQKSVFMTTPVETLFYINEVIKENDSRYDLTNSSYASIFLNTSDWAKFIKIKESEEDFKKQASLINNSRDKWISARNNTIDFGLIFPEVVFTKKGTGKLVESKDENGNITWDWEARDASAVTLTYDFLFDSETIDIPLYGVNYTTGDNTTYDSWLGIGFAETWAKYNTNENFGHYGGLVGLYELQDPNKNTLELTLVVELKPKLINRSLAGNSKNSLSTPDSENYSLSSISKGEIRFERSFEREDHKHEYSNMYNPFWYPRLVDSTQEKYALWGFNLLMDAL